MVARVNSIFKKGGLLNHAEVLFKRYTTGVFGRLGDGTYDGGAAVHLL